MKVLPVLLLLGLLGSCRSPASGEAGRPYKLKGALVPATVTMVAAWDVPRNPATDASLDQSPLSMEIRAGFRLFMNTPGEAKHFAPGRVSCENCHLNGGQRERALPLVAVAGAFPEYNKRAGHLITLADRIVDCFQRSENATGSGAPPPTATSREVLALSAYLTYLARGYAVGGATPWRGQNTIGKAALIPLSRLDPSRGQALFAERCTSCHGPDGQGVQIGDKKAAPLWGPDSWNDGAGAARVYTLAGIIRYTMPYLNPGSLSDEEAQQLAAFITSKPRPSYPFKAADYRTEPLPSDAVYYPRR